VVSRRKVDGWWTVARVAAALLYLAAVLYGLSFYVH